METDHYIRLAKAGGVSFSPDDELPRDQIIEQPEEASIVRRVVQIKDKMLLGEDLGLREYNGGYCRWRLSGPKR